MSCLRECQEIKVYDYNTNKTTDILSCSCTGCCNMILVFIYFLFFCVFLLSSILICKISNYKKNQRGIPILTNNHEQLPAYTENV